VGNLNFLQLAIGYIIGRIIVSYFLLPKYFEGELLTAYAYLERRFGAKTKNFASSVFMITRVFADGVRLYATAIPIAIIFKGYNMFTDTRLADIFDCNNPHGSYNPYYLYRSARCNMDRCYPDVYLYRQGVLALIVLNSFTNINFPIRLLN
jgi:hypothetical protein